LLEAGFMLTVVVLLVAIAVVAGARIIAILIALRGVPAGKRAEVLRALAQCFRHWNGRGRGRHLTFRE
jgi:hypothetical protein